MLPLQSISTQVSADVRARLEQIAHDKNCSSSDIIKELVEDYVSYRTHLEAKVNQGLEDLKAGRTVSHEEVKEMVRGMGFHVD